MDSDDEIGILIVGANKTVKNAVQAVVQQALEDKGFLNVTSINCLGEPIAKEREETALSLMQKRFPDHFSAGVSILAADGFDFSVKDEQAMITLGFPSPGVPLNDTAGVSEGFKSALPISEDTQAFRAEFRNGYNMGFIDGRVEGFSEGHREAELESVSKMTQSVSSSMLRLEDTINLLAGIKEADDELPEVSLDASFHYKAGVGVGKEIGRRETLLSLGQVIENNLSDTA